MSAGEHSAETAGIDKTSLNGLSDAEYRRAHQRMFPVRYVVSPIPVLHQDSQDLQDQLNEMAAQGFELVPIGPIVVGDPAYEQDACLIWRAVTSPGQRTDGGDR